MILIRSSLLVAFILGPALTAQATPLGPRSFAPEDYDGEVVVDVARLVDLGLLAEVQRSPLNMLLGHFRDTFGFDIEDVERVRFAIRQRHGAGEDRLPEHTMWVFEGGAAVALGKGQLAGEARSVGDVKLLQNELGAVCSPRPGLVAFEPTRSVSTSRMAGLVDGTKKGGVPCPALLEITSKPGVIASIASVLPAGEPLHLPGVGPDWTDDADKVSAIAMRLSAAPGADGDGDALAITAVLRFEIGETGPVLFQTKLKAALVGLAAEPKAKPIKGLIEAVTTEVAGRDLVVTLPLGAGRAGSGKLAQVVTFLGALALSPMEAVAEEVVFEDVTEPEPAPPPPPVRRR